MIEFILLLNLLSAKEYIELCGSLPLPLNSLSIWCSQHWIGCQVDDERGSGCRPWHTAEWNMETEWLGAQ